MKKFVRNKCTALSTAALVLLTFMMIFVSSAEAAIVRNFTPRYQINVAGDTTLIGNTLLTNPAGRVSQNDNNDYDMDYVDIDSVSTTFNSSAATLAMPAGSTVVWAGLYWGANLNAGDSGANAPNASIVRNVLLATPTNSAYTTLTATQYDSLLDSGDLTYQGFVDVTAIVKAAGNGTYRVANVQAATGENRFAGWSLVVVYQNPSLTSKNLTVFDGYADISTRSGGNSTLNINVSGFQTPTSGAIQTAIGVVAYEGDRSLTGDQFRLNGTAVSDAVTSATNFFNSRISNLGTLVTTKNPSYENQLGFDIKLVNAPNTISNGASSAVLTFTSEGDRFLPGVLTFGTLLYTPNVIMSKTVDKPIAYPGDVLTYTISVRNSGVETATNAIINDQLPPELTYVPGSIKINGVAQTDTPNNDQGYYDATNKKIYANIGTGAGAATTGGITNGGTLAANMPSAILITFQATVDPTITAQTTIGNVAELNAYANILGYNIRILSNPITNVQVNILSISGYVYDDFDNTATDNPLAGVTVTLTGGASPQTTTTNATGFYQFTGLKNLAYTVTPTAPAGMAPTYDPDQLTGANGTSTVTLPPDKTNFNFGFRGTNNISGALVLDMNASGTKDSGEPPVQGVMVVLEDGSGNVIRTTATNASGIYQFNNLPTGTFAIRVNALPFSGETLANHHLPDGLIATFDPDGIATLNRASVTLTTNQNIIDRDFGYRGDGRIGDLVWIDYNANGTQDSSEPGINGANVAITWTGTGFLPGTYTFSPIATNSSGGYLLSNLPPGSYQVGVSGTPAGLTLLGASSPRTYSLATSQINLTADFGYRGNQSIAGRLHLDWNNNNAYDSGESSLPNVTLTLTNSDGNVIGTTTTASDGTYQFANLSNGSYKISIQTGTLPASDIAPTYDPDGAGTPNLATVALSGSSLTNQNFGYRGTGLIGDLVWYDQDANGSQNGGELGAATATVKLTWPGWDNILGNSDDYSTQTSTNSIGVYTFTGLPASSYKVEVDTTTISPGVALVSGSSPVTATLTGGQIRRDIDFGYQGQSSISGVVVKDENISGTLDGGDTAIPNVTVLLLDMSGTILTQMNTDLNGQFAFTNILPGNYKVQVRNLTIPTGLVASFDPDGIVTRNIATVAAPNSVANFGYRELGVNDGLVWRDTDGNQTFSNPPFTNRTDVPGEVPYAGVTVWLYDGPTLVATRVTGSNGIYSFADESLIPNHPYTLKVDRDSVPDGIGYNPTTALPNSEITLNTDASGLVKYNFGFNGRYTVSGHLWEDLDHDNLETGSETSPTSSPIHISLFKTNSSGVLDSLVASTTTDATGYYHFDQLLPIYFKVVVQASDIPAGLTPSYDYDEVMGNPVGSANSAQLPILAGDVTDVDFAYIGTGDINGYAWLDNNGNGINDSSEVGITGITVTATLGTTTFTTTTNSAGFYAFESLSSGSWTITLTAGIPAGTAQNYDPDGTLDGTTIVTLTSGQAVSNVNFGYIGNLQIAGTVWVNSNGDGVIDSGEPLMSGIEVQLLLDGNLIRTTTTNGSGAYLFDNLLPETYSVQVVYPGTLGQLVGYQANYDKDGIGTPNRIDVILSANVPDANFGYVATSGIKSIVWLDINGNTLVDSGELGLAGVEIGLFDSTNIQIGSSIMTDSNGFYEFDQLPPGTYIIKVLSGLPSGVANTYSKDGPSLQGQGTITLLANTINQEARFGYRGTSQINVLVWYDLDSNGLVGTGESGIANAVVRIVDSGDQVIGFAITDSNGMVSLPNLTAGNYRLEVLSSSLPLGINPTYDPDDTGGTVLSAYQSALTLAPNQTVLDPRGSNGLRFGFRGDMDIRGYVWNDEDGNGVKDTNESPLPGVSIQLEYSGPDGLFGTADDYMYGVTVTDSAGNYEFAGVSVGLFRVTVTGGLVTGYKPTYDLDGINTPQTTLLTTSLGFIQPFAALGGVANFGYRMEGTLQIKKSTNTRTATIGSLVLYTIEVKNTSGGPVTGVSVVDKPPAGFKYVANSGRVGNLPKEPTGLNPMIFEDLDLAAGETLVIRYLLVVGAGVQQGTYKNLAYATNEVDQVISNESSVTVEIQKDPIFETTTVIGQVFDDKNGNGFPDAGERGVPGVKVASINGDVVTTDADGRFHFAAIDPKRWDRGSMYILKIDTSSLPVGTKMISENPKTYRITVGSLAEINFAVQLMEQ